jgi:uncharacterized protein (DUF2147 family)
LPGSSTQSEHFEARAAFRRFIAAAAALLLCSAGVARAQTVEGRWLTQPKHGIVEIFRCGDRGLCGRLLWVRVTRADENPEAIDNRNPRTDLRSRSLCGLTMMWGFQPDGSNRWTKGSIYDPESGNTYQATLALQPDGTLELRGYVLVSLFGRSETWTRVTTPTPHCPSSD